MIFDIANIVQATHDVPPAAHLPNP
jgi:hypothetical protein